MTNNPTLSSKHSWLPFAVPSENRSEQFSPAMEKAAVFCLAELDRNKGGGMVLKQKPEKTELLAKMGYPLWLVPWNESTLVFDGIETPSHTVTYRRSTVLKTLAETMKRSAATLENFTDFLSDRLNELKIVAEEKKTIKGLITDTKFLNEFGTILSSAREDKSGTDEGAPLTPILGTDEIAEATSDLDTLKSRFESEVAELRSSLRTLTKMANGFAAEKRAEIKLVKEEFEEQIRKLEQLAAPRIAQIEKQGGRRMAEVEEEFHRQLLPLQKEKTKLEKILAQTTQRIENANAERKSAKQNKNVVSERKWKEKAVEYKKEEANLKKSAKQAQERIRQLEDKRTLGIFNVKSEIRERTKEARKDILEAESDRDAKIHILAEKIETLQRLTSQVTAEIDNAIKARENELSSLAELGLRRVQEGSALVYVPFYVAAYRSDARLRYSPFAPVIVNSVGLKAKISGALGGAKIRRIFTSRVKAFEYLLAKFPSLTERNAVLREELMEEGNRITLLKPPEIDLVRCGLTELKNEGWLTEKELAEFSQAARPTQ